MQLPFQNLTLFSYKTIDDNMYQGKFALQLNPSSFKETIANGSDEDEELAGGGTQFSRSPAFRESTWDFSFVLDNTGTILRPPPGCMVYGTSIADSIDKLNNLFVVPDKETHTQPYVKGSWAMGGLNIFGKVTEMDVEYTFFDASGIPLRAKVDMKIDSHDVSDGSLFRSPDISRLPKIIEGDNLVDLCRKFYGDASYYLKIAQLNNLNSFRKLKPGSLIEFPPIEK